MDVRFIQRFLFKAGLMFFRSVISYLKHMPRQEIHLVFQFTLKITL